METLNFTQKFIHGLETYGLTYDDLTKFKYCGGDTGRHLNYFKIFFLKYKELPDHMNYCICDHHIKDNCYITDGKQILTLGNCCIKRFIPKSGRTCEKCGESHKNRIINRCNTCRKKKYYIPCMKCGKKCDDRYETCYFCYISKKFN